MFHTYLRMMPTGQEHDGHTKNNYDVSNRYQSIINWHRRIYYFFFRQNLRLRSSGVTAGPPRTAIAPPRSLPSFTRLTHLRHNKYLFTFTQILLNKHLSACHARAQCVATKIKQSPWMFLLWYIFKICINWLTVWLIVHNNCIETVFILNLHQQFITFYFYKFYKMRYRLI